MTAWDHIDLEAVLRGWLKGPTRTAEHSKTWYDHQRREACSTV